MKPVLLVHTVALLALLFAALSPASAQVQPIPFVKAQWFDNNGRPNTGGCLFSYQSGTSTPLATYKDALGSVPNSNPVLLDAAGRASVFLSAVAYRLTLKTAGGTNCASGVTLWSLDGINPSVNSLLSSNNLWLGSNTWNATSTFNGPTFLTAGFTSSGPSNLNSGGALVGSFSGSPVLSGLPNFSGGFKATTGTFSGQIISTLIGALPPFQVGSTVEVVGLNVNYLENNTWELPGTIGSGFPNTGRFSTLAAVTSFQLAGSSVLTSVQGSDTGLMSAGTISNSAPILCTDANGGATTSGCRIAPVISQDITYCSVGCTITGTPCTTSGSSNASCTNTLTWPIAFADVYYSATCSGIGPSGVPFVRGLSKTASTVTVTTANGTNDGATASSYNELDCHGGHN